MRPHALDHPAPRLGRRILAALLAALWLVCVGGRADAAVFEASARAGAVPAANTHRCKCGMDCQGRCCCEKKAKSLAVPSKPKTPSAGASVDAGPCMGAAPCGAGLPGAPSAVSVVKSDAIQPQVFPRVEGSGAFLAIAATLLQTSLVSSRLDDPPERSARV